MQDWIPRKIDINQKMTTVVVKQFDNLSRFLHVQMMDRDLGNGDEEIPMNLAGCDARLYVELPDGQPAYVQGETADGENGIVTFTLPGGVTWEAGCCNCEIRLTEVASGAVISTQPFVLRVEPSIQDDEALMATEKYSALEHTLLRVAVDRARLDHLEAMANSAGVVPGTSESELVGIRTGYDGTVYASAGNAVREQIADVQNAVAAVSLLVDALADNGDNREAAGNLIAELQEVLENAQTFQTQIDNINRSLQNVAAFIADGGITNRKIGDGVVSAEKLASALRRPSVTVSAGTVAALLRCAESYFDYAYTDNGQDGGLLYESGCGLYADSLGQYADDQQFGIMCSAFAEALLNGITFENSRYSGNETNAKFSWGIQFDDAVPFGRTENPTSVEIANRYLTSQALAQYAAKHGYLYAIDGNENIRPGDVLFSGSVAGRYLGIDHVAVAVNADGDYCTVVESWPSKKADNDGTEHDVGVRIRYHVPVTDFTYGAVFPLGDVPDMPDVLETVYDTSGRTAAGATVIHAFERKADKGFYTVVCRGQFDTAPYVSLRYDGASSNAYQAVLHGVGDAYYLTVYVQRPAVISLRMVADQEYDAEEIILYRGYAEITARCGHEIRLAAGDDLDHCPEGVWYCPNSQTAAAVLHAPLAQPTGGFRLEAVRMTHGERYRQCLWYVGSPECMYVRMYSANGWTSWYAYSGTPVL